MAKEKTAAELQAELDAANKLNAELNNELKLKEVQAKKGLRMIKIGKEDLVVVTPVFRHNGVVTKVEQLAENPELAKEVMGIPGQNIVITLKEAEAREAAKKAAKAAREAEEAAKRAKK